MAERVRGQPQRHWGGSACGRGPRVARARAAGAGARETAVEYAATVSTCAARATTNTWRCHTLCYSTNTTINRREKTRRAVARRDGRERRPGDRGRAGRTSEDVANLPPATARNKTKRAGIVRPAGPLRNKRRCPRRGESRGVIIRRAEAATRAEAEGDVADPSAVEGEAAEGDTSDPPAVTE